MNKFWQQLAIGTNWPVLLAVAVLSSIGIVTIWADTRFDTNPEWPKQIIFLVVAALCMALFQAVDYRQIGRFATAFYVFSFLLVLYTVVGGFAESHGHPLPFVHNTKGAHNWINFGYASLQPAELMKIAFVMVLARYLRFRSNYRTIKGLLAPFALALVPIAFILKQPDLGTALIFIPALFVMLFVAGAKIKHLLLIVVMGLILVPIAWWSGTDERGVAHSNIPLMRYLPEMVKTYQRQRVYAMFSSDPRTLEGTGFQQQHALISYGSGGIVGKGLGRLIVGRHVPEG